MKTFLLQKIKEGLQEHSPFILAIDGPAGSGKSTLASALAAHYGCPVIHMDDFFLPVSLRLPNRLQEPGGNIHYERFEKEVLAALRRNLPVTYQRYDCQTASLGSSCFADPSPLCIVEGSYSLHPRFGRYYSLAVFLDVDEKEQEERIRKRAPQKWPDFRDRWIPMEQKYFDSFQIRERADICLRL